MTKRVAILGGGLGSMAAAWALTKSDGWQNDYDVTVYQLGWRLGGKAASGRNAVYGDRIEEHGLHVWMGFYQNAFRIMQECYTELGRPPGAKLRTWDEAFKPSNFAILNEFVGGRWSEWSETIPTNDQIPGQGNVLDYTNVWAVLLQVLVRTIEDLTGGMHGAALDELYAANADSTETIAPSHEVLQYLETRMPGTRTASRAFIAHVIEPLHQALAVARKMAADAIEHTAAEIEALMQLFGDFLRRLKALLAKLVSWSDVLRRLFILADFAATTFIGLLADGVTRNGWVTIDNIDFRAWLKKHGADPMTYGSSPVREIYDLCFAYEDGRLEQPRLAAGTAVQIVLLIGFAYKGAPMWKMQAGMGDVVFAPLYLVLKQRGVKFEFFRQVTKVEASDDGHSIAAVHIDTQATLVDPAQGYDPLVDVKGLPCWPSAPLYDQLVQGKELRERGIDLESKWNGWAPVEQHVLRAGVEFDHVILGISRGALESLCADLIERNGMWRDMIARVKTVQTQSMQLWFDPTIEDLGRTTPGAVAGTYAEPFDTWADMSELLAAENWQGADPPQSIVYLCGPKRGGEEPPADDTAFPAQQREQVRNTAVTWLDSNAAFPFPKGASTIDNPAGLDFSLLHAKGASGEARFDQQYWRANIDPSEKYVLSLPGSTNYRLRSWESGFDNLSLAGDWVYTAINAGCVEGATMGGMAAAKSLAGEKVTILGWPNAGKKRRKVAVLGGGCGSMAAIAGLMSLPYWYDDYDITVYQLGWRLGGKGASGRNAAYGHRIQEHGLHVWGGFYENAFRVMQSTYGAIPVEPGETFQSWRDAFKPLSNVILQEDLGNGQYANWEIDFPTNPLVPGTGGVIPPLWVYVVEILCFLENEIHQHLASEPPPAEPPAGSLADRLRGDVDAARGLLRHLFPSHDAAMADKHVTAPPPLVEHSARDLVSAARTAAESLQTIDASLHSAQSHFDLLHLIESAEQALLREVSADCHSDPLCRRLVGVANFGFSTIRGLIRDGVITNGFTVINDWEWRDWLQCNGALDSTLNGPIVNGIYDYVFGFIKGDAARASLEAGTATHGVLRLFFTYKGAIFWEMQAGMGDVVFGAFYRQMHGMGIHFRFFHKVTNLGVAADNGAVERVDFDLQATPRGLEYEPLEVVNGVYCWPSNPFYDQLVQGEELRAQNIDLESAWTPWTGTPVSLARGRDFDDVVLGIAIGAFPYMAKEVIAASPRFAAMVEQVGTVQTANVQLWIDAAAADIGAPVPHRAATACIQTLNTWSDMSFLLPRETWGGADPPQFLAYFCGGFADAPVIPPFSDHGFPARELARLRGIAIEWLQQNTWTIWPKAVGADGRGLRWELLHDAGGGAGPARLDAQYLKVNIDPTERYVASFPNTSKYRLRAGESGLANLWLAGDWLRTPFNAGCVEAAVVAGLSAAQALSGKPVKIVGGV